MELLRYSFLFVDSLVVSLFYFFWFRGCCSLPLLRPVVPFFVIFFLLSCGYVFLRYDWLYTLLLAFLLYQSRDAFWYFSGYKYLCVFTFTGILSELVHLVGRQIMKVKATQIRSHVCKRRSDVVGTSFVPTSDLREQT